MKQIINRMELRFPSGSPEILFCDGDSLLIILDRYDFKILRTIFTHKKCGEANGCPHLQNTLRPVYSQKHFYKALHFSPDDRHPFPDGILLQFFKKRCISHIQ